jgi:DNA-binding transcriptional LysR family regulator
LTNAQACQRSRHVQPDPTDRARIIRAQRAATPPFAALRAFEAVGSCGGIRRAAAALSIDHAAVSRHLHALEQWTGMSLIDRSGAGHGNLTEQGRAYHTRISAALAEIALATQDLMRREDDVRLRLWVAPGLASEWLSGRVGEFMRDHPAVELELQPSDTPPAFAANEADAYLHYIIDAHREAPPATLRSIEVARPAVLALASPAFIANTPPFPPRPTCWTARCCMKRATTNGGAGSISMASAMSGSSGSEVLAGASDAGRGAARGEG